MEDQKDRLVGTWEGRWWTWPWDEAMQKAPSHLRDLRIWVGTQLTHQTPRENSKGLTGWHNESSQEGAGTVGSV